MNDDDKIVIESLVLDQIAKIYNKGVKEGQQHAEPSSKTLLMIEELRKEISKIREDFKGISVDICYIKEMLKNSSESYVRKEEFEPIKRLVYGVTGLMLSSIILGLLALLNK